jgi:hypothetical protein
LDALRASARLAALVVAGVFSLIHARADTLSLSIQDVSSEFPNRQAVHSVDGSGLDANNPPNHNTTPTATFATA